MGIKSKSLFEVTCDLCKNTETIEAERPSPKLDALGYRRVKLLIEPIHTEMAKDLRWTSPELVLCRECLKKLRQSMNLPPEDATEHELDAMKKTLADSGRRPH